MGNMGSTREVYDYLVGHRDLLQEFTSVDIHRGLGHRTINQISAALTLLEQAGCIRRLRGGRPVIRTTADLDHPPRTMGGKSEGIRRNRPPGGRRRETSTISKPPRQYIDAIVNILGLLEQELQELQQAAETPNLHMVPETALWAEIKQRRLNSGRKL